ncbi:hypothetical protein FRZ06_03005 [Anoxybacterium hadale]|uniref:Uncharacterized protein n=1 Tax=Anoxybacterium hadale TaxID=3408580 RepID=A0ACD1A7X7_9FIRM|nr:hypothetical protein FRZ06_03005 [Clostridiales bacterium]
MFRDLKISKSELCCNDIDISDDQDHQEQKVRILPRHIIAVLENYQLKNITEEKFAEWVQTVWFSDFFEYCDECSDCISLLADVQEEVNEEVRRLDDHKIEKYIQTLLNIDESATGKTEMGLRFLIKEHLLSIVVGLQVLYSAIKILMFIIAVVGIEPKILINAISIMMLLPYVCIIYLGVEFLRERPFAWYGITSSFLYLLYKSIIECIILGVVLLYGDSIAGFYEMSLSAAKVNNIPIIIGIIISIFVLRLLLQNDTLTSFNLKGKSKLVLILINTGIVVVTCALYFAVVLLLVKH